MSRPTTSADRLLRAVNRPLSVRIVVALTTELCREAARRHQTSPAVALALGRGLTGGLLLSTLTTGGERVTIQLSANGPLRGLTIDAYGDGSVRGYPDVPQAFSDRPTPGRRLCDLVGRDGVVNILRDVGLKDRYQGQVPLRTGEVDEDLEAYLRESEQIPSALGCEVILDEDDTVRAAGGFLVQVMPSGNTDLIRQVQHRLRTGVLHELLQNPDPALTPQAVAEALLPDIAIEPLDERPLCFRCRCSRERIEAMLLTLSPLDLGEMIEEGQAEITCNYCNEIYRIDRDTLRQLRDQVVPAEKN